MFIHIRPDIRAFTMNILLAPFRFLTGFVGYRIAQSIPSVNLGIVGISFSGGFASFVQIKPTKSMGFDRYFQQFAVIQGGLLGRHIGGCTFFRTFTVIYCI